MVVLPSVSCKLRNKVFLGRRFFISSSLCPHAGLSGSRVMVMAHSFEHAFAEQRRPEWRYIAYDVLRLGKKHLHAALVLNHG